MVNNIRWVMGRVKCEVEVETFRGKLTYLAK